MYEIELTTGAKKDLKSKTCRPHLKRILQEIKVLKEEPLTGSALKGSLVGVRSLHFKIKGSGEWRTAYYLLSKEKVCLVLLIDTRENFYKKAVVRLKAIKKRLL